MTRLVAILLIILTLSAVVAGQRRTRRPPRATPTPMPRSSDPDNGEWVKFTSEFGRFSVLMPEIPADKTEITEDEPGPYTTYIFTARDTKNIYMIAWVDYDPKFNFHGRSEMYANRDYFIKGMNGTLVSSRLLRVDGYLTLEFTAENDKRVFKSRVYMVGRRPYQVVVSLPKDQDDQVAVNRFFNSVKIRSN